MGMYMPHDEQAFITNQKKISTDLHETEGKKHYLSLTIVAIKPEDRSCSVEVKNIYIELMDSDHLYL